MSKIALKDSAGLATSTSMNAVTHIAPVIEDNDIIRNPK